MSLAKPLILSFLALLLVLPSAVAEQSQKSAQLMLPGVNLPSGSFGDSGDLRGRDYTYPTTSDIDYLANKGFKSLRLAFLARRVLKATGSGDFVPAEDLKLIEELVGHAAQRDMTVVLDMHDYGLTGSGKLIGRDPGSEEEFAAQWRTIAKAFAGQPNVVFGLMNEPNRQSAAEWLKGANAAVAAIREAGADQLVLVPGSYWDGAHSWTSTDNADVMWGFQDPGNNFAFEVHQYLDRDSSGTHKTVTPGAGSTRLADFTAWARKKGVRGFLGEFGWAANEPAQKEGHALLCYMSRNQDVWLGWSYWAAGPWWGDYMYSIQPSGGAEKPQMAILEKFLGGHSEPPC